MKVVPRTGKKARNQAAPPLPPGLGDAAALTLGPPAGPRPEAEPTAAAQISQGAAQLARLRGRLGLTGAEALAASATPLVVDPYARAVAACYEQALPASAGVLPGADAAAAELGRCRAQLGAAVRLYAAVAQMDGAVAGTRRLYAAAVLRLSRQLVRRVRALLADERIPRKAREKLRSDAAELLAVDDRLRAQRGAAAEATKGKKAAVAAEVGEVRRQRDLFRAMLSMHRGEAVPPMEAAEAAATYEALTAAPAETPAAPAAPKATRRRR